MEVRPAPIMYASLISAYPDMWQDASIIQTSYGIIHVIARRQRKMGAGYSTSIVKAQ